MEELWKDIQDYEGLYKISNLGRIRRVERYVDHLGGQRLIKSRIRKSTPNQKGYHRVRLSKNNEGKNFSVSRLVGIHFINKPEHLTHLSFKELEINHIDGDKNNNTISNLEWCTHEENIKHACDNNFMNSKSLRKPIRLWNNEGFDKIYDSCAQACEELNLDNRNVSEVAVKNTNDMRNKFTGDYYTLKGYKIKYI